ncbi:hypothetical protein FB45DRAFT_865002 [Roridomyces roridus]|uniref:Uncharacterized protein n=1 Tax=Roridomyces roridus TaxID=1738132 RepID=A0AAD7FQI6_9AGAR|nr:hypothetical protein FB45DRAFT_865002 [Roridomyces roridus]
MLAQTLALCLTFSLVRGAVTVNPGVYHLVNLGSPYAPASFDDENRVYLPQPFSGEYDLWQVTAAASGSTKGVTIENLRQGKYAQISPPAQGQFVSTGTHPSIFSTVLSGTADFPGDPDNGIPDRYLDYWTIGAPNGLVWTYDSSAGPEVSLRPLTANRTRGQYWMFAAEGALPFSPRDRVMLLEHIHLSPVLV